MTVLTTEEKLQHFLDTCMEDARTRSNKMLDEYMSALEKTLEEHKEDAHRRADMILQQEAEKIQRDINKKLSFEQIGLKRTLGLKQEELKDKLFVELKNKLAAFLETPEYQKLLEKQIQSAVAFANGEPITIYLDPADSDKRNRLALHHGSANIQISEYSFSGGCRAVIPSRHILIDNSFEKKLEEAREKFHFDSSLTEGGTVHE